jgi:uncharacterized protein (DUF2342 family)
MSQSEAAKQARKAALKKLREDRRPAIEAAASRMKGLKKAMDAIREQLKEGDRTVPELAEGAGLNTSEAMWMVATLKKYGEIAEGEKDGGYFRYKLLSATQ